MASESSTITITNTNKPFQWREKMPQDWEANSTPSVKISPVRVKTDEIKTSAEDRTMSATETATTTATYIVKVERYDEDIMKQMLVDTNISTEDRKRLSYYFKHARTTPSKANVSYELGKNCQDLRVGRLYPAGGVGLQSFRRDIRTPLLAKYYWDVDMENCHYNIALKFAREYGIGHRAIEQYCMNRDTCLALYSDDRTVSKTAFLKLAYGGDLSLFREDYEDVGSHNPKPEAIPFIRDLKQEMTTLAEFMWSRFPQYHKLKGGKENKTVEKRNNNRAVLMSLVLQDEEKKCLRVLDDYLLRCERYMGVLIHDGGAVEKLDGELEFPAELLVAGANAIREATGYSFRLTSKSMKHSYEAPIQSANAYAKMKADFEKRNFLVGAILNQITRDGVRLEHKMSEASIIYANLTFDKLNPKTMEMVDTPFLTEWLRDKERRDYERCDFVPNMAKCPESVFNLFNGFAIESVYRNEMETNGEICDDEMMALIEPIRRHNRIMCGGDATFYEKWEANMLQNPDVKSDVGIFFRDKGGLLFEGGGTGKNVKMDWFGTKILGEQYYLVVDDNSLLYGAFNSVFEGKLLVFVEEAAGKDNHNNSDVLKSKITKKRGAIKKKMIAEYVVNDYARFIFGSNNPNPLPIRQGDRRLAAFDVDATFRNNQEYFETLVGAMENVRVQCAYYQYLKTISIWKKPIEFQRARPITDAYIDIRQMNAPAHMKWLRYELRRGTLPEESGSRELYQRFCAWYDKGNREAERRLTETAFGTLMKEAFVLDSEPELGVCPLSEQKRTMNGTLHKFDFAKLIDGMVKLHLLKEGECVVDADGFLIKMEEDE